MTTTVIDFDERFSFGTSQAMLAIFDAIRDRDYRCDTVCINMTTLLRNLLNKDMTTVKLLSAFREELQIIIQDIIATFNAVGTVNPAIILYIPNYIDLIPKDKLRSIPASQQPKENATINITSNLTQARLTNAPIEEVFNGVKVIQLPIVIKDLPHVALRKQIQALDNQHRIVLLSHEALDYYLFLYYKHMWLAESYINKLLVKDDLVDKLYKTKVLPFDPLIHAILGDKTRVKCNLSIKDKRRLLALAEEEHWALYTHTRLRNRLRKHGFEIPQLGKL